MEAYIVEKFLHKYNELLINTPTEEKRAWNLLSSMADFIIGYDDLDCLMHVNFINGRIKRGICIITDWSPGAIAFIIKDGSDEIIPAARVIYPEEFDSYMESMKPFFEAEYPESFHSRG